MEKRDFASGGPAVSRLGFGCAPVMGRAGRWQSLDAMACAFAHGVTHFDIARSYGFGDAEKVLGTFIRGRRHEVTITTKFGVVPPQLKLWQRLARPVVRPLRKALIPIRHRVHAASGALLSQRRFDATYAAQCLETSLRELHTDYIDFYLVHEPALSELDGADDLRNFLEQRICQGQIRAWGVAHPGGGVLLPPADWWGAVVQLEASPNAWRAPWLQNDTRFRFITRPMGGRSHDRTIAGSVLLRLGEQLEINALQSCFALASWQAGERGAVVTSMFTRKHIHQNVQAVDHYLNNRQLIDDALNTLGQ